MQAIFQLLGVPAVLVAVGANGSTVMTLAVWMIGMVGCTLAMPFTLTRAGQAQTKTGRLN